MRTRCWLGWACALGTAAALPTTSAADLAFPELYQMVRSNLTGFTEADLNRTAVNGFLESLHPHVLLVTNAAPPAASDASTAAVSRSEVIDQTLAYIRLERLATGSDDAFKAALDTLAASNRLEGLVLDLRFTAGDDFAAAGRVADRFVAEEQPLLDWGTDACRSTAKTNAFEHPVAILVNRETGGAAEALAAALRAAKVGLLLGSTTPGRAAVYRELPLGPDTRLRIAVARVRTGDGKEIPVTGLSPDIEVAVPLSEEREFYKDPYRAPQGPAGADRSVSGSPSTNRPIRLTEADLVRMRREGLSPEDALTAPTARSAPPDSDKPAVTDPALSRALDLLKGLAIFAPKRGGD
ncbi:MAG TPA: S41 family peptidase [Verrucomicrobiota bacterium]|nr:S41 family peptidase [Verrucomicrobiota bacterium]